MAADAVAVLIVLLLAFVLWHAWVEMRRQGVIGSFSVLFEATRWDMSSSVFPHDSTDPYWLTLATALGNTLAVGIPAIVLATVAGTLLGLARTGTNKAAAGLAKVYVEVFRNVPAILQIIFWYAVLLNGPRVADAWSFHGLLFVSNRGLVLAWPQFAGASLAALVAGVLAIAFHVYARATQGRRERSLPTHPTVPVIGAVLVVAAFALATYDVPVREGFAFRGGRNVSIEYFALLLGLTLYGVAYIAEIVRGGLNAVPRGHIEAAEALGLRPWATFLTVRAPLALRVVMPSMSNQYLFLMKGTGLGIVVGFAELFQVTVTSINQTGKSIDFLIVMMAGYGVLNFTIAKLMSRVNARLAIKER